VRDRGIAVGGAAIREEPLLTTRQPVVRRRPGSTTGRCSGIRASGRPIRGRRGTPLLILILTLLSTIAALAGDAPEVRLLEPHDGRPVAGKVRIRVKPIAGASPIDRVVFRVDGTLVDTVEGPPWQITWDAGIEYAPHILEVTVVDTAGRRAMAQRSTPPILLREYVTVMESPLQEVLLSVTVTDRKGESVTGLTKEDFGILENGRPQTLSDFGREGDRWDRPLSILLLIDRSSSMRTHLAELDRAVAALLSSLRAGDEVAVAAVIQGDFKVLQPFVGSGEPLEESLQEITYAAGGTPLFSAIGDALVLMRDRPGRRVLLTLTDGWDDILRLNVNFFQNNLLLDLARRAQRSNTQITLIWPGPPAQGKLAIESLVEETGGLIYYTRDDMGKVLEGIARDLQDQYYLAYFTDDPARTGQRRRIEVAVTKPGLRVRTIGGFFSLPSQLEVLREELKDEDEKYRAKAVRLLAQLQVPDAGKLLRSALRDKSPVVRTEAARGLGMRRDPGNDELLTRSLGDSSPEVRAAAYDGLLTHGQPATPALLDRLHGAKGTTRVLVLQLLGEIGDDRALEPLVECLPSQRVEERAAAAAALGALGLSGGIAPLADLLDDPDKRVRAQALRALGEIGGRAAVKVLESYGGRETDPELRHLAADVLAGVLEIIRGDAGSSDGARSTTD
jgi:VWFA-related protein